MLDNLKPHKASFSFSHSPLGALSLVIDSPYHPTKYQATGKKSWYHPYLRKVIVTVWQTADISCICSKLFILFVLWTIVRVRFIVHCFLWLSQLGVINYITWAILWAHNFHWVQWKADSVYFVCEKKKCLKCLQLVKWQLILLTQMQETATL